MKANALNQQFQSVFTVEPDGEVPTLGNSPCEQISHFNITREGIEKLLNLKADKSPGPDGIPPVPEDGCQGTVFATAGPFPGCNRLRSCTHGLEKC